MIDSFVCVLVIAAGFSLLVWMLGLAGIFLSQILVMAAAGLQGLKVWSKRASGS